MCSLIDAIELEVTYQRWLKRVGEHEFNVSRNWWYQYEF